MRFRFVGSESQISEVRLCTYGQAVELDTQMAHTCILGGVGLVTEDVFNSVGHTDDELERHADNEQHRNDVIEPEFAAKKRKLHAAFVKSMKEYQLAAAAGDTFMARAETKTDASVTQPVPAVKHLQTTVFPDPYHEPPVESDDIS